MDNARQALLVEAAEVALKCKIAKDRHHIAGTRKHRWRTGIGFVSVLCTTLIASKLLTTEVWQGVPGIEHAKSVFTVINALAAWIAAVGTALLSLLRFEKDATLHAAIGNRYVALHTTAQHLVLFHSQLAPGLRPSAELVTVIADLHRRYESITADGEALFTSIGDQNKAKEQNDKQWKRVKDAVKALQDELPFFPPPVNGSSQQPTGVFRWFRTRKE